MSREKCCTWFCWWLHNCYTIPQRFTELDSLVRTNKVIFVIVKTFSCRQEVSRCRVRGESKESTTHRRGSIQMSDHPLLWNPEQTSPDVQNRGIRDPTKRTNAVVDPGGAEGAMAPSPVQISHKKMAAKGGHIDFMFLAPPPPYPAAGSDAAKGVSKRKDSLQTPWYKFVFHHNLFPWKLSSSCHYKVSRLCPLFSFWSVGSHL